MVQAVWNKGVENRTLAFCLHDVAGRRGYQRFGFPTTVRFAEGRLGSERKLQEESVGGARAPRETW